MELPSSIFVSLTFSSKNRGILDTFPWEKHYFFTFWTSRKGVVGWWALFLILSLFPRKTDLFRCAVTWPFWGRLGRLFGCFECSVLFPPAFRLRPPSEGHPLQAHRNRRSLHSLSFWDLVHPARLCPAPPPRRRSGSSSIAGGAFPGTKTYNNQFGSHSFSLIEILSWVEVTKYLPIMSIKHLNT